MQLEHNDSCNSRLGVWLGIGVLLRLDFSSDDKLADIVVFCEVEELADLRKWTKDH